jgi:membrane-associated phospholipid phosphatase
MKQISKLLSWIFLPLFTPIYGLLIVLYLPVQSSSFVASESLYMLHPDVKFLFLLLFLVFIVMAPGLSLVVLRLNKTITSLQMESKEERLTPIAIMTFYCIILYLFLMFQAENAMIPSIIKAMVVGGALSAFIAYFITKKSKISLHGMGMGSLFGFVYMFSVPLEQSPLIMLTSVLVVGGLVMTARLFLKSHSLKEVGAGYLLGFASQVICIYFYP